jgi:hypothetical protein
MPTAIDSRSGAPPYSASRRYLETVEGAPDKEITQLENHLFRSLAYNIMQGLGQSPQRAEHTIADKTASKQQPEQVSHEYVASFDITDKIQEVSRKIVFVSLVSTFPFESSSPIGKAVRQPGWGCPIHNGHRLLRGLQTVQDV